MFGHHPGDPSRRAILGHPTASDDAWEGHFLEGVSWPGFSWDRLRPNPRNASARLYKCPGQPRTLENAGKSEFWAPSWGPPRDEPFWATRQRSTTREEAPFWRGCSGPAFRGRAVECPRQVGILENAGKERFLGPFLGTPHDEPFWATRQQATTRGKATFRRGCRGRPSPARRLRQRQPNASARLQKCPRHVGTLENAGKSDFWAPSWGPPHDEPIWATRQHSTTRGKAPFWRGCPGPAFLGRAGRKASSRRCPASSLGAVRPWSVWPPSPRPGRPLTAAGPAYQGGVPPR